MVQEVLQVLADPQVPEYRLFQLGLEVLSLPEIYIFSEFSRAKCVLLPQRYIFFFFTERRSNVYDGMLLPVHLSLQKDPGVPGGQDARGDL